MSQKESAGELFYRVCMLFGFEVFLGITIYDDAKAGKWFWFGVSLVAFALWSAILGWMSIEDLQTFIRRRRAKNKELSQTP